MKNTISDKEWKSLQDRAIKANRERAKVFSDEGKAAMKKAAEQYKKRHQN